MTHDLRLTENTFIHVLIVQYAKCTNSSKVEKALSGGPQLETLVDGFNITLSRKDIQTLKDMTWLNDEVSIAQGASRA